MAKGSGAVSATGAATADMRGRRVAHRLRIEAHLRERRLGLFHTELAEHPHRTRGCIDLDLRKSIVGPQSAQQREGIGNGLVDVEVYGMAPVIMADSADGRRRKHACRPPPSP